jgi:hypothetical protein
MPINFMSEEQKTQSDKSVNQVLTDRLNKAYIAKDYTLLNGGTDNIILIQHWPHIGKSHPMLGLGSVFTPTRNFLG